MNSPRQDDSNNPYRHVWGGPHTWIWKNARDHFGPPQRVVMAPRRVVRTYEADILPGQLCFIAQNDMLYDGQHAIRWKGRETVCTLELIPGKQLRLWWESSDEKVTVERYEIDYIGAVVGLAGNDSNPMFWLFGN